MQKRRHIPWHDEHGITALEYSLLAVLVALALIGGVTALGSKLNTSYSSISTHIK